MKPAWLLNPRGAPVGIVTNHGVIRGNLALEQRAPIPPRPRPSEPPATFAAQRVRCAAPPPARPPPPPPPTAPAAPPRRAQLELL